MGKRTSRRRLLAGVGAAGVGSVGGLALLTRGAQAYPNTTPLESTPLRYDWRETYNGRAVDGGTTVRGTAAGPRLAVSNVLPGDRGSLSVRLRLDDGADAAVRPFLSLDLTGTAENGINDPEARFDDTPERGELQEFLTVAIWYDTGLEGVDAFGSENGIRDAGESLVHPDARGSLAAVAAALSTPTVLDPAEAGPTSDSCLSGDESLAFVLAWSFDADAGPGDENATQSDGVTFDLGITVEECG